MRWFAFALGLTLAGCGVKSIPERSPYASLHATTVYLFGATLGQPRLADYLAATLPAIKANGFNAVWLPAVWQTFDPRPLATPHVYDDAAFTTAAATLDLVRSSGMQAIVGLNYVGVGYAPDFGAVQPAAQACDWAVNPATYAAFEVYATEFLTRLSAYAPSTVAMVFTEGAEGCGQATQAAAPAVAVRLQGTLGSLPTHLPPGLRATWRIGYHDYSIVNLGWGNGIGPIANSNPFDLVSMVAYNVTTTDELDVRAARFTALYPDKPLIVGEMGFNGCPNPVDQAVYDTQLVSWALAGGHGFNLWGWPNAGSDECTNPVYGGLAITNSSGAPNAAALAVKALLQ